MIIDRNTSRLCRRGRCCPVVKRIEEEGKFEGGIIITDDYDGLVKLTKDEVIILIEDLLSLEIVVEQDLSVNEYIEHMDHLEN